VSGPITHARGECLRLAFWFAISAGVGEEVLYRGLLTAVFVGILGWAPLLAAFAALAVFIFGHLYQGKYGILGASLIGFNITLVYILSGSLIPGIIVHVTLNVLAFLFLPVGAVPAPVEPTLAQMLPTPSAAHKTSG
jgi:membrane protease YdiL (CAAX protease family)